VFAVGLSYSAARLLLGISSGVRLVLWGKRRKGDTFGWSVMPVIATFCVLGGTQLFFVGAACCVLFVGVVGVRLVVDRMGSHMC